jgi:hypothetical protein
MKATLLLADHAAAVGGKLYINGGGWTVIGPNPHPSAIAMLVHVPWDQTNVRHTFSLELLDADGNAITTPDANPIKVESEFEVGRPAGVKQGTTLSVPLAFNFGPIPLTPGSQFEWRLSIDGHPDDDWRLTFTTRPAPPQALAA